MSDPNVPKVSYMNRDFRFNIQCMGGKEKSEENSGGQGNSDDNDENFCNTCCPAGTIMDCGGICTSICEVCWESYKGCCFKD